MKIRRIPGGVTAAKGFRASCCAAGIKYQGRTDMAMIAADVPCAVAGTFTSNLVKAAPVLWDMDVVYKQKQAQAVVVNAGIANAATGEAGMDLCRKSADCAAAELGIPASSVLLGSTGVIGPVIPLDRISCGITQLAASLSDTREAGTAASKAIMTTDTVNKEFAVAFDLPSADGSGTVTVHLGGMSKGSGMIHPNMCTMLGYITTDCAIDQSLLQHALSAVVKDTFNMITVDGDTSTNDTLLVLSSALAGNAPILEADESYSLFRDALYSVCRDLAVTMAGDGEGATHLIEMRVCNADTKENAQALARSVAGSSLVKAMVFGKDANCGRILCALGYAGPYFDPAVIELYMNGESDTICFYKDGRVQEFDEDRALKVMSEHDVRFTADMKMGTCEATAWGCDLTYDYVKINGDYRS
ncbi:MAG: bifunctional glutamate N-acetyltransferase/amino-acid acetyltransferase ArgJ [Clostridiales bacterium]|nr:bifunctional glutamate N-acetyltransferase/amino-acid acetyltransferase ArgJ [Clostridiales bacterium]